MTQPFALLPVTRYNRPYLSRIAYADDDFAAVRARLLARLPNVVRGWNPALTPESGDYGAVMADLFAYLAAIIDGYADHRVNEGLLRTATLTRSVIDLAELVDYRLGAGASAAALQAFVIKPDKAGEIPAGFKLNAEPPRGGPTLAFETAAAIEVDASRNLMRIFGFNRSDRLLRVRGDSAVAQDDAAALDAFYAGLKAGVPVVFAEGANLDAWPPASIARVDGVTRLAWAPGSPTVDRDYRIANLTLHGRPQHSVPLAAAARADEITIGQTSLPVANAAMFSAGSAILIDGGGLQMAATVLSIEVLDAQSGAGTIALNRGLVASLRRSATRVLEGTSCGYASNTIRAGETALTRQPLSGKKKDFPHTPNPGDLLLLVDASGVEIATVARASGASITLAQPLSRALRPTPHVFDPTPSIRFFMVAPNDPRTHKTSVRPVLLGELDGVYVSGNTVLDLARSVDAFAPGGVVALGDGTRFSAHRILAAASVEGRTLLTLAGSANRRLKVAPLLVHGDFEHVMHIAGFNRSERVLPSGTAELEIDGTPRGVRAGLEIVLAEGTNREGARVTQVVPLTDRTRIALARPLDNSYALASAVIYGNVVPVTHGASSPDEILGSGDPAAAPQRFLLRRTPLAWIADPAAERGVAPAVEVFVDAQRWTRVLSLADSGPNDRHYVIDIDDRERATVVFGDGVYGAAPVSGRNNIVARYRVGHGVAGNVGANAISKMPQALPFVDRAFNPLPASGGADRESVAEAKRQTRFRVRTLDRAVSLSDYADLALTMAGVAKARADLDWEGRGAAGRRVIVVTCASAAGAPLSTPGKEALVAFLRSRSPEPDRIRVRDSRRWPIRLAITVHVRPDYQQPATHQALLAAFGADDGGFFSFESRELGDDLSLSSVYALAEATAGVDHVLATSFHAEGDAPRVADTIRIPADALATGGHATEASVGRLSLHLIGGLP